GTGGRGVQPATHGRGTAADPDEGWGGTAKDCRREEAQRRRPHQEPRCRPGSSGFGGGTGAASRSRGRDPQVTPGAPAASTTGAVRRAAAHSREGQSLPKCRGPPGTEQGSGCGAIDGAWLAQ